MRLNLVGQQFGRLEVIQFAGILNKGPRIKLTLWLCRCSCGETTTVRGTKLTSGYTTSCGCRQREASQENGKRNLKHGYHNTPEYYAYHAMKQRCYNPNYHHYENWGGRGIKVCKRWLNNFENFLTDLGPRPSPQHSLDRKNNNGNYTPSNCQWTTAKEQANNRRNNRR